MILTEVVYHASSKTFEWKFKQHFNPERTLFKNENSQAYLTNPITAFRESIEGRENLQLAVFHSDLFPCKW